MLWYGSYKYGVIPGLCRHGTMTFRMTLTPQTLPPYSTWTDYRFTTIKETGQPYGTFELFQTHNTSSVHSEKQEQSPWVETLVGNDIGQTQLWEFVKMVMVVCKCCWQVIWPLIVALLPTPLAPLMKPSVTTPTGATRPAPLLQTLSLTLRLWWFQENS